MAVGIKHIWTEEQVRVIRDGFHHLTNQQLADKLGLTLTLVRMKCYELGLKRMELEYWTATQVAFLRKNFTWLGDKEIASIFNERYRKNKLWTVKHIAKKRGYLNLYRTDEQLAAIKERTRKTGVYHRGVQKMWQTRGVASEGDIRFWKGQNARVFPVIKKEGRWIHWAPYTWQKHHGMIAKGMNVVFKDCDPYNLSIDNLEAISNAANQRRNNIKSSKGLSDNYVAGIMTHGDPALRAELKKHPDLIQLKRKQLILNRTINEKATY